MKTTSVNPIFAVRTVGCPYRVQRQAKIATIALPMPGNDSSLSVV